MQSADSIHAPATTSGFSLLLRTSPAICVLAYLLLVGILLPFSLRMTEGHFVYALDDPYIHLELARNIAHGTYGINSGEFTTPSSSLLWPFLLTIGASSRFFTLLPFILNIVCGLITAGLLGTVVDRWPWESEGRHGQLKRALTCTLLVIVSNLVGLTYVGMEHTLQVLLAVATAIGIVEAIGGRRVSTWCIVCAAVAPSVRYENVALLLAMAVAVFVQARKEVAITALIAGLAPLIGFALVLRLHGLPPLPNSVLVKAHLSGEPLARTPAHLIGSFLRQLWSNVLHVPFDLLLVSLAFVLWRLKSERAIIAWAAFSALVAQALVGKFGWFHRYEVYAVAFGAVLLFCLAEHTPGRWSLVSYVLLFAASPYLYALYQVPRASRDIYCEQYQMGRFVRDFYRRDFAVNDLGLTGMMRPQNTYVLDLYGLASNEARSGDHMNASWLESVVHRHGIGLVMIYPEWFSIPQSWEQVAVLHDDQGKVTAAFDAVTFYATPDGDAALIRQQLVAFRRGLPAATRLELTPPRSPH